MQTLTQLVEVNMKRQVIGHRQHISFPSVCIDSSHEEI